MSASHSIFTAKGERKYVIAAERERFIAEAAREELPFFLLCLVYCLTGCRVSEACELKSYQIDADESAIRFRTLKRRTIQWRSVPVPTQLIDALTSLSGTANGSLFAYSRTTVWRRIKRLMAQAGISGAQATPKALRHYFGVQAGQKGIPQPMLQRWMGHARLESTAIYQQAVGAEERLLAERLNWLSS